MSTPRTVLEVRHWSQMLESLRPEAKASMKLMPSTHMIVCEGKIISWRLTQKTAVLEAQDLGRNIGRFANAQVRVFNANGQIRTEYTYGDDPVRSKG